MSNLTSWQVEYGGGQVGPWRSLLLFAVLALVLVFALDRGQVNQAVNDQKPATLCEEHAGRPGWSAVCDP